MKIGLYGSIDVGQVKDKRMPFIAVDGGLIHLLSQGITPQLALGDYDSLIDQSLLDTINHITLPKEKDDTDLEAAIKEAIKQGYDEIDIYGVTGYRLDHFFAAIRLLVKYKDYLLTIHDSFNKITLLLSGKHVIKKDEYTYLSFFSVDKALLTLKNVKYPLNEYPLSYSDPLCVSNEIIDEAIIINDGDVFMIQSKDKV